MGSLLPFSGRVGDLDYRPVRVVPRECSIADASRHFAASDIEYLVVHDHRIPIGVVYKFDLVRQNMTRTLPQGDSVVTIMDSEVVTVQHHEPVLDALMFMIKHDVKLLVIMRGKEVMGIVTQQDWVRLTTQHPTALLHDIAQARDIAALAAVRARANEVIWRHFETSQDVVELSRVVTVINDTTTSRVLSLLLDELRHEGAGSPPAVFAWIGMGSAGRGAQTVLTDQDNGLIYENLPAECDPEVRAWFERFAERAVAGLDVCGFARCAGNTMATNPSLLGSLDHWQALFERIVRRTDDSDLFEASIYFDFRCLFGNAALGDALMSHLQATIASHPYFLRHLVQVAIQGSAPPVHTLRWKLYETTGVPPPPFDIKRNALMPLEACVRVLALLHGITAVSTLERIQECLERGALSRSVAVDLRNAFDLLFRLRFKLEFSADKRPKDDLHMVDVGALPPAQARCVSDALRTVDELREFTYRQVTGQPIPWSFR